MRSAQIAARDTEPLPIRVRIAVPATGLGKQLSQIQDWLDHNVGADGWAMTPSGERGVLNDALSIHLADATIASAFVARWCIGYRPETADGLYRIREDEPKPRVRAPITSAVGALTPRDNLSLFIVAESPICSLAMNVLGSP